MRRLLVLLWLLIGRWLLGSTPLRPAQTTNVVPQQRAGTRRVSVKLAELTGMVGAVIIVVAPWVVTITQTTGSEALYTAAAQALPALLIAVILAYRTMLSDARTAIGRPWTWRGPWLATQVNLSLWAMLTGFLASFIALADCEAGRCGSGAELVQVYLGLGASVWLIAQLLAGAFLARMREFEEGSETD